MLAKIQQTGKYLESVHLRYSKFMLFGFFFCYLKHIDSQTQINRVNFILIPQVNYQKIILEVKVIWFL